MSNELCVRRGVITLCASRCVCSVRSFRSLQKSMQIFCVCARGVECYRCSARLSSFSFDLLCSMLMQLKLRKNVRD